MTQVYHDNGRADGRRTRFFRDGENGGVEWMYGVDYANGDTRWYGYGAQPGLTIERLKRGGMFLSRIDDGTFGDI